MKRLLITGVPGTGKTTVGDHLNLKHGVLHVDIELDQYRSSFSDKTSFVQSLSDPVVITWGFHPLYDEEAILFLKKSGFFLVWLDGDRQASHQAFTKRNTVPEDLYNIQMENIESTQIISKVKPQSFINPFDTDGKFRPVEEIAQELMAL